MIEPLVLPRLSAGTKKRPRPPDLCAFLAYGPKKRGIIDFSSANWSKTSLSPPRVRIRSVGTCQVNDLQCRELTLEVIPKNAFTNTVNPTFVKSLGFKTRKLSLRRRDSRIAWAPPRSSKPRATGLIICAIARSDSTFPQVLVSKGANDFLQTTKFLNGIRISVSVRLKYIGNELLESSNASLFLRSDVSISTVPDINPRKEFTLAHRESRLK